MRVQIAAIAAGFGLSAAVQAADGNWSVYAGVDMLSTEISVSRSMPPQGDAQLGSTERIDNDSEAVRVRAGLWLNEDFAVELQTAAGGDSAEGPDTGEIDSYFGAFIVPRAQPFSWLDMTFPLGVTMIDTVVVADGGDRVRTSNESLGYGVNFEFRLGEILTDPDSAIAGLGIGAGFMVYDTSSDVNVRGINAGLHFGYDF